LLAVRANHITDAKTRQRYHAVYLRGGFFSKLTALAFDCSSNLRGRLSNDSSFFGHSDNPNYREQIADYTRTQMFASMRGIKGCGNLGPE
jgi:hypothetical protein